MKRKTDKERKTDKTKKARKLEDLQTRRLTDDAAKTVKGGQIVNAWPRKYEFGG